MATLLVARAGILTTVQDLGRRGWGAFGVPVSGAMDAIAARIANTLVGNPPDAPLLELTGPGAVLAVDEARVIAVTGADLGAVINDGGSEEQPLPRWQATTLSPGQMLRFSQRRAGARAILAVAGGLTIEPRFGSAATDVTNTLGGWEGRPLRAGDHLPLGSPPARAPSSPRPLPADVVAAVYEDPYRLRFLPPPRPTRALTAWLEATPFLVTPQSNRVGFRLRAEGAATPVDSAPGDLVSEPIAPGTLQLPPDGHPILLMADRQTIGGYPIAGHVIAADLSRAAQLWPGDRLRLVAVSAAEARLPLRQQADALARWLAG